MKRMRSSEASGAIFIPEMPDKSINMTPRATENCLKSSDECIFLGQYFDDEVDWDIYYMESRDLFFIEPVNDSSQNWICYGSVMGTEGAWMAENTTHPIGEAFRRWTLLHPLNEDVQLPTYGMRFTYTPLGGPDRGQMRRYQNMTPYPGILDLLDVPLNSDTELLHVTEWKPLKLRLEEFLHLQRVGVIQVEVNLSDL